MHRIWKNLITAIYALGVIMVAILLALIVSRSHIVLFPDAMLPMELHELSSTWLAFGFIPMIIFSILFYGYPFCSAKRKLLRCKGLRQP